MEGLVNLNAVTANNEAEIAAKYKDKLKGKKEKTPVEEALAQQEEERKRKASVKTTKGDVKLLEKHLDEKSMQKRVETEVKQKVLLCKMIAEYKERFPQDLAHVPHCRPNQSLADLKVHLSDCRQSLASAGAETQIRQLLPLTCKGLEWVTMEHGINPMDLELHGFGHMMSDPDVLESLEPEITEMVVELRQYFQSPWYLRLGVKMAALTLAYSERKKASGSHQQKKVPEEVAKSAADL